MPRNVGINDFTLTVGVEGGAISELQNTFRLDSFAVKCADEAFEWEFEIVDKDGFPVYSSDGTTGKITGTQSVPVQKRCAGFFFILKNATPGIYEVRCNID